MACNANGKRANSVKSTGYLIFLKVAIAAFGIQSSDQFLTNPDFYLEVLQGHV